MQENVYFCRQIVTILILKGILTAYKHILSVIAVVLLLAACSAGQEERVAAPWGETVDTAGFGDDFDLDRIMANGELIMLTLSGPDTYYNYRGRNLGLQYMLCQKFADKIGVRLRVEVCRDTAEMLRRLADGDADMIAYPLTEKSLQGTVADSAGFIYCGTKPVGQAVNWVVGRGKPALAAAVMEWYVPKILSTVRNEESRLLSSRSVRRRVYAPMLNRKGGIISRYDHLFMTYSQQIRWDWRLMAAQCYQESTFDPQARSWAGACGLMQIMPGTAKRLGLPESGLFDPESNVAAASKYIGQLERKFTDIKDRNERISFVLASYNGGYHHIRDAMALAVRDGKNPHRWNDVSEYVLLLSEPRYYRDPIVKYGYMRGSETVGYVSRIRQRWMSYRGVRTSVQGAGGLIMPRKAVHSKKKFRI